MTSRSSWLYVMAVQIRRRVFKPEPIPGTVQGAEKFVIVVVV